MAYTVNKTDGSVFASVADGAIDTTSSLVLIGRNTTNYGEYIAENFVKSLENFAHTSAPSNPLTGQLFFNKNDNALRVYNGSDFERVSSVEVKSTAITTNLTEGTMYFDTKDDELKVYANSSFRSAVIPGGTITDIYSSDANAFNSSIYGAKIETLFLTDNSAKVRPVIAVKYYGNGSTNPGTKDYGDGNSTIMAIFSDHAAFSLNSTDPRYAEYVSATGIGGGSAVVNSGITLRSEYSNNPNARSDTASLANIAYAVDLSDPSPVATASGRVAGKDLFRNNTNVVPDTDGAYTLGATGTRFSYAYLDALNVGPSGSTASGIFANGTAVDIGTSSARFNNAFFNNIDVSGNVVFGAGSQNIGSSVAPAENLFAGNATLSGTVIVSSAPAASTHATNKTYVDTEITSATSATNVVRTTGTQAAIAGAKTFTSLLTGSSGVSDGTATLSSGSLASAVNGTFSGTVSAVTLTASGTVNFGTLTDSGESISIAKFVDEADGISSNDNDTSIPTSAAVKDYVDTNVTAQDLDFQADSGGALSIDLDSETLDIAGGTNITTVGSGNQVTVNLDATLSGLTAVTASGAITGGSLTDGTLSINSGSISSGVAASFSGNVTANYFVGTATQAQYADLAEVYKADREYGPGTVVKIGGSEEITHTTDAFDNDVFGVISENPAYLMNAKAEGLPVALTGRVKVKVIGKISKGERLVSADMEGFAWGIGSEEYDPRAVIGRSLEDKDDGESGMVEAVIGVK